MKDRTPRYPGRVRLTPVSGQTNVYDMVRADEPEQEGTKLNKNSLLTDETAASVWPNEEDRPEDPTVNNALNKLGNIANDAYAVKGTVKFGDEYYDVLLDDQPYFYLRDEAIVDDANYTVWLSADCIGYIRKGAQYFYDRSTGELLSSFAETLGIHSNGTLKLQLSYQEQDLYFAKENGGYNALFVFNYRTGEHKKFTHTYGGYYEDVLYGGRRGNTLYFYGINADYGFKVWELDADTLEEITTRSVTYQSTSSSYTENNWLFVEGVLYRIGYTSYSSKVMKLETVDLGTGENNLVDIFTDTDANHERFSIVPKPIWIDPGKQEIYFTYAFWLADTNAGGDRGFAKYNYDTGSFSVISTYATTTESYPQYYCGNIDDSVVLLNYSSSTGLYKVNLDNGEILAMTTTYSSDSPDTYRWLNNGSQAGFYRFDAKTCVRCGSSYIVDTETLDRYSVKYLSDGTTSLTSANVYRFGDEYLVTTGGDIAASGQKYKIYSGENLPECRDIIRAVRRDS